MGGGFHRDFMVIALALNRLCLLPVSHGLVVSVKIIVSTRNKSHPRNISYEVNFTAIKFQIFQGGGGGGWCSHPEACAFGARKTYLISPERLAMALLCRVPTRKQDVG